MHLNGKQFENHLRRVFNETMHGQLRLERGAREYKHEALRFNHKVPISKKLALLYKHTKNKKAIRTWFAQIKRGIEDYVATVPASFPDFIMYEGKKPIAFVEVKFGKHYINIPQLVFHLYLAERYGLDYYIFTDDGVYAPIGKVVKVPYDPWDLSTLPTIKFDFTDGKREVWFDVSGLLFDDSR